MNRILKFSILVFTVMSTQLASSQNTRVEKDEYGEMKIPSNAYYGLNVARAMKFLNISNETVADYPTFIKSLAIVKQAAIEVNTENGALNRERAMMLNRACQSIIDGGHNEVFQFELFNGSQGYLANAAINEVLANLAIEMSGARRGNYKVIDPFEDVNLNQNYPSVYQTSLNLTMVTQNESLLKELESLQAALLSFSNQESSSNGATAVVPTAIETVNANFAKHKDSLSYHIANLQLSVANLKYHTMNGLNDFKDSDKTEFSDQISKALRNTTGVNFKFQNPVTQFENHLEYITTYLKAVSELNDYIILTCKYTQAINSREIEGDPYAFANINRGNGAPTWGHIIPGMVIENCIRIKGRFGAVQQSVESKKKKSVNDINLIGLETLVSQQELIRSVKTLRKNFLD